MDRLTEKNFRFELVSPEKILASEEVYMVTIPGEAGDFGVLADHAPLLSSVRPGVVTIVGTDLSERRLFVSGGFADVTGDACSLLAEEAVPVSDLDAAALEKDIADLHDDLGFAREDQARLHVLQRRLAVAEAKLAAVQQAA